MLVSPFKNPKKYYIYFMYEKYQGSEGLSAFLKPQS